MARVRETLGSSDNGAAVCYIVFDDVTGVVSDIGGTTTANRAASIQIRETAGQQRTRTKSVPASRTDDELDVSTLGLEMAEVRAGFWEPQFDYSIGSEPA